MNLLTQAFARILAEHRITYDPRGFWLCACGIPRQPVGPRLGAELHQAEQIRAALKETLAAAVTGTNGPVTE